MEREYPKVLVVTSSTFNPYTGTGVLLSNLFKDWPKDKIAICYSDNFYHNKEGCPNAYKIGEDEIKWIWPLNMLLRKNKVSPSRSSEMNNPNAKKEKGRILSRSRIRDIYLILNRILGGEEVYRGRRLSRNLMQWIDEFKPDILYCHISSLMNIRFNLELKNRLRIPLCIHIMDDWLGMRYKSGIFAFFLRHAFHKAFKILLAQTAVRMVIGEKMAEHYEKEFGYAFIPFSNALDLSLWMMVPGNKREKKDDCFDVVYAGTINSKNMRGLENLGKAIKNLNAKGHNIRFKIFTFQPRADQYRPKYEAKPYVTVDEVPENDGGMINLLQGADLLVLPVDFTKDSIERMRYSMFAKIPAYMASGTPVLVYGPTEVASVEYSLKAGWAYVVPEEDEDKLEAAIIRLVSDTVLRESLVKKAQELVLEDFDVRKVGVDFHTALTKAAQK